MGIIQTDVKDLANVGSAKETYGLHWRFGDMCSSRPSRPSISAPAPYSSSRITSVNPEPILEPINPQWPIGRPQGENWRGTVSPDLCICDYFEACEPDFSESIGRNAISACNRVLPRYGSLANALYASQYHMAKKTDFLSKTALFYALSISSIGNSSKTQCRMELPFAFEAPLRSFQFGKGYLTMMTKYH